MGSLHEGFVIAGNQCNKIWSKYNLIFKIHKDYYQTDKSTQDNYKHFNIFKLIRIHKLRYHFHWFANQYYFIF